VARTRYPRGAAALSIAKLQRAPVTSAAEDLEWFRPVEVDLYSDVQVTHDEPMAAADQRRVRLAYFAGITHVDDQVGRLLDALVAQDVDEATVTVLTADHAQNLGEANMWSMMNLLETSLRVPLMIRPAPSDPVLGAGRAVPLYHHPVELLDLFPTLTALAGLPLPPAEWKLPGSDLSRGMREGAAVKPLNAAYSQITRCVNCTQAYGTASAVVRGCVADSVDAVKYLVPCAHTPRSSFDYMGMSVRVSDWRYSTFCAWDGASLSADWSRCHGAELYDHRRDTSLYDVDANGEPFNLAGQAATRQVQEQLHALLRRRFAK
jgi:iduronate 2-sulfatase